jgi:tRNA(Arg) A34 adenosine deaminase TadA
VSDPNFDDFDHETHMRSAFELAREAADRGDRPFGSVLVRGDSIVFADSNRVLSEDDIRHHPELHLAYRACRQVDPDGRTEMVMYTSTEPCPMCAGGMVEAGFGQVVYGVSGAQLAACTGDDPPVRSSEILTGTTTVVGPILNKEGREIHHEFDW